MAINVKEFDVKETDVPVRPSATRMTNVAAMAEKPPKPERPRAYQRFKVALRLLGLAGLSLSMNAMTERSGDWIRDWRERNGYTQENLAGELDVKRQTIISWEKSPKLDRLIFLALTALEADPVTRQIGRKASRGPKPGP